MKQYVFCLSLLMSFVFCSCKGITEKAANQGDTSKTIENFDEFINKFGSDSIFRTARIKYPVKGYNSDDIEENNENISTVEYEWTSKMLNYYLNMKYTGNEYVVKYDTSQGFVKETIIKEGSGFKILSKYVLIENKWYLNYYFYQNE